MVADIQLTGTLLSSVLSGAQAGDPGSEARNVTILTPLAFNENVYALYIGLQHARIRNARSK